MFTEVIKLVPALDRSALNTMFQNLNQRFAGVARKFGDGLKNAFKFGGVVGIATALISKLLNPLQQAEEIIDRILNKGDDAVTYAEEFNTDPGKLLRLEALGKAKGLDSESLRNLITKFQGALAKEQEAAAAPGRLQKELSDESDPLRRRELEAELKAAQAAADKGGTLHEFIDEKDTVDAFFKFVQSLQAATPARQTVVRNEVFGERIRGKAAEFLNAKDFEEILAQLPTAEAFKKAAIKTGQLSDTKDLKTVLRESQDFVTKSGLVSESQVNAIDQSERQKMQHENEQLMRFDKLKSSSIAIQELTHKFDKFATDFINTTAPEIIKGIGIISKVAEEFLPDFKTVKDKVVEGFDATVGVMSQIYTGVAGFFGWKDAVTGEAPAAPSNTQSSVQEGINSVSGVIDSATGRLERLWDEMKGSRWYRTANGEFSVKRP